MRDPPRMRDRIELQLDNRQIVSFVIGALVVLGVVFAVGVLVGKQLAVSARPPPATQDALAAIDAKEKNREGADSVTGTGELPSAKADNLTYATELTRTPQPGSSPIEPTKPASKPAPNGAALEKPAPEAKAGGVHLERAGGAPAPLAEAAAKPAAEKAVDRPAPTQAERPAEKKERRPSEASPAVDTAKHPESLAAAFEKATSKPSSEGQFCLQVSSGTSKDDAEKLVSKLSAKGISAYVVEADPAGKGHVFRVRVGTYSTRDEADVALKSFKKKSALHAIVTASH